MSQALYRKYRSRSFDEIVGQAHITDTLSRALKAGHVSHAYLFTGPRGTGKTSVARILAYAINNLPYADTTHLDIIEIDAASNRRIDDIRDLREKVHIAPVSAAYKVYIIDEVHMLTGESFNALLKTLEEPPAHAVFILATTEAHKLPATIISRTQRFAFRTAPPSVMVEHLKSIAAKEKLKISDDALALIAEHGGGSFRDSVSLLDQLSHVSDDITAKDIQHTLGLAPQAALQTIVAALVAGDHATIATTLGQLEAQGSTPSALTQQLTRALSQQAAQQPNLYNLIDQLLDVPRAYDPSLKLLSSLMVFATAQNAPAPKPAKIAPALVSSAPTLSITRKTPAPTKPKQVEPTTPQPTNDDSLTQLTPTQWVKVLQAIKKANAPLFSVIKQAQPRFDTDTHTITLAFKYQLHRKKMDDAKLKAATVSIMRATLGASATIATAIDATAAPFVVTDDPTITSVAAIMGGGEPVSTDAL